MGPSGCGKTTLLKCLLGLLKYENGEVFINQEAVCNQRKNKVNLGELGYMPQVNKHFFNLKKNFNFLKLGNLFILRAFFRRNFLLFWKIKLNEIKRNKIKRKFFNFTLKSSRFKTFNSKYEVFY